MENKSSDAGKENNYKFSYLEFSVKLGKLAYETELFIFFLVISCIDTYRIYKKTLISKMMIMMIMMMMLMTTTTAMILF